MCKTIIWPNIFPQKNTFKPHSALTYIPQDKGTDNRV